MEITQIVLEYIKVVFDFLKVLAWPLVVLFILRYYDDLIRLFLKKLIEKANEIPTPWGPIKFQELREFVDKIPDTDKELKEEGKEIVRELAIPQARELAQELAPQFFSKPSSTWYYLVEGVRDLSLSLELSDILHFANSKEPGEHVVAGIALEQHIREIPGTDTKQEVIDAVKQGIKDKYSRVRVRFIEAIGASKELSLYFKKELDKLAKEDPSPGVRDTARRILDLINA
jgi:hypothetical protein